MLYSLDPFRIKFIRQTDRVSTAFFCCTQNLSMRTMSHLQGLLRLFDRNVLQVAF